jgi:hypothetical protein
MFSSSFLTQASGVPHSIDSFKLASGGWKLSKESVAAILPDLKEVIEQIPDTAPVILFCLDNTCFKVATAEGELTISLVI